jgi:hypothetical protein
MSVPLTPMDEKGPNTLQSPSDRAHFLSSWAFWHLDVGN